MSKSMSKSMLEYLASLRAHGCTPQNTGDAIIGRTAYAAGSFTTDNGATRIALMPMYRTDWVTADGVGPMPELLPASYRRSRNTVYYDHTAVWYISGWNLAENVLWLDACERNSFPGHSGVPIDIHWEESFETSLRLASPEVLARIAAQTPMRSRFPENFTPPAREGTWEDEVTEWTDWTES